MRNILTSTALLLLLALTYATAFAADPAFHKQPQFTKSELKQFMQDFPAFQRWAHQTNDTSGPTLAAGGIPSFQWTPQAAAFLQQNTQWEPRRFFYVMTHTFAGMTILTQKTEITEKNRPETMPEVPAAELEMIKAEPRLLN